MQIIFKVQIGTMHHLLLSLTLELERICLTSPECVSNLKVHLNDTYIYVKCNSPVRIFQMHHAAASIHAPPSMLCSYCDGISTMHIRSASPGCICVLQPTAVHHFFGRGNLSPGGQKQKPPLKIYKVMMTKMMMVVVCVGMWGWGAGTANPPQSAPSYGVGRLAMCILALLSSSSTR